jgi:spermidine synthase
MGYFLVLLSSTYQYTFQIFASRSLISFSQEIAESYAIVIGSFLLFHSLGLYKKPDFETNNLSNIRRLQFWYFLAMLVFLLSIYSVRFWQLINYSPTRLPIHFLHVLLSGCTGYFTGKELNLVISHYGLKYIFAIGISYGGPVIGLFLSHFFYKDLKYETLALVFLLLLPFTLVFLTDRRSKFLFSAAAAAAWLFLLQLSIWFSSMEKSMYYFDRPPNFGLRQLFEYYKVKDDFGTVNTVTSPYQTIDTTIKDSEYFFFIDRNYQFSSKKEASYHNLFIELIKKSNKQTPVSILIIGGGDGLLARNLLRMPNVDKITLVELDQKVIDLAKTNPALVTMNENSLSNPKVEVIVADGYAWLMTTHEKFDFILMDLPVPNNPELSRLFSLELFHLVYRSLTQSGAIIFDFPALSLKNFPLKTKAHRVFKAVVNSLSAAGFTNVGYTGDIESLVYGTKGDKGNQWDLCKKEECNSIFHPVFFSRN